MNYTIRRSPYIDNPEYRENAIMHHSNHSYMTNNKIVSLFCKDSWKDQPCFITAGGPSLAKFDFSRLKGKLSIGINKAFLTYAPSINYSMDSTFYEAIINGFYDEQEGCRVLLKWLDYPGHRIFLTPMELKKFGPEVWLVRRKWKADVNKVDLEEGIWGGENSAAGAINLAISLGADPIYLLGYDMKCGDQTHYHNGYVDNAPDEKGQNTLVARDPVVFNAKLKEYREEITALAPLWKESGNTIINLGPDSDLTCFPFQDLDKVLGV